MDKTVVSTTKAPGAIGAYSQGIKSGDLVFCSGQVGLDPEGGELVGESVAEQTRQCVANLAAVLEAAGCGVKDIVKTTVYLADMSDFGEFNEAYGELFSDDPPARATIGVAALPKGARVEIECVARA